MRFKLIAILEILAPLDHHTNHEFIYKYSSLLSVLYCIDITTKY